MKKKHAAGSALFSKRPARAFLGLGLATLLASCALLTTEPAPSVYDLAISDDVMSAPGRTRSQILITEPKVLTSLNNDRIVIKPTPAQIAFLPGVRWSDRLPRLVQLYLSRAFSSTKRARAVGLPGDGLIIDHQLLFDLTSFQLEVQGGRTVAAIEMNVRILNDKNGRVIASEAFKAAVPASDEAVAGVAGLNKAMNAVAKEVITWVLRKI